MLHLQYLDPQTPLVVRRRHFYLGPEMFCGRQIPGTLIASRWAVHHRDPQAALMGSQRWGQLCIVSDLAFPKVNRQICLLRDCRTALGIAITTGEHGSSLVPAGPCAQWFLCSHVTGALCEGRKHTLS